MRKVFIALFMIAFVAGCSSTPTKEQEGAAVEDRSKPVPPPTVVDQRPVVPLKPDATTKPLTPGDVGSAALKDPKNILSKRSVYFDYDSNLVKDEYKPLVSAHARYVSQNRNAKAIVQGNTDERGSREYNLALGQRRADSVKQMMVLLGAAAPQIETVSFGEEKPRAQGNDEKALGENRRADIVYEGE
jgi:peptidoglycan-associated lipoprotein